MKPWEIWLEQCEAARQIEAEFGTQNALDYLIGEKFLKFLQAAEDDADFRAEIPAFGGNPVSVQRFAGKNDALTPNFTSVTRGTVPAKPRDLGLAHPLGVAS